MIIDYTEIIENAKNAIQEELKSKKYVGNWVIQFGHTDMVNKVPPRYLRELYEYAKKLDCCVRCVVYEQTYILEETGAWRKL